MAYLGNNPDAYQYTVEVTRFNGTGACTEFQIPINKSKVFIVSTTQCVGFCAVIFFRFPDNAFTIESIPYGIFAIVSCSNSSQRFFRFSKISAIIFADFGGIRQLSIA